MSSDGEVSGPSPLPSPIFARCSPARGTVARKCREFYLKRLERTASMQQRWSICSVPREGMEEFGTPLERKFAAGEQSSAPPVSGGDTFEGYPLRKCRSSFDLAMDSLRKEISSLIAQDNDLFRQLLSLHDSIAEMRERQRHSAPSDDEEEEECRRASPSLESLSDTGELPETSPESTLSSRSSLSGSDSKPRKCHAPCSNHRRRHRKEDAKQRQRTASHFRGGSRPLVFIDRSEICFRCRKMAPPYRRSSSTNSLHHLHEDMESYDSGIHLHSDSDHEIFV